MNPEIKAKWVSALRSGEYQQGTGRLRVANGFCCLAVATDLYMKETGLGQWCNDSGYYVFKDKDGFIEATELPSAVMIWANLDTAAPYVSTPGGQCDLISMNDAGTPFAVIAELIEEYL